MSRLVPVKSKARGNPRGKAKAYIREVEIDDSEENGDDCDCENLGETREEQQRVQQILVLNGFDSGLNRI